MVDQQSAIDRWPFLDEEGYFRLRFKAIDCPGDIDRHRHSELTGHRSQVAGGAANLGDQAANSPHDLGIAWGGSFGHHNSMVRY